MCFKADPRVTLLSWHGKMVRFRPVELERPKPLTTAVSDPKN
uniref:Transcription factor PIF3 isoform X6 n=1 Tax=Rhizophora mucronata TaxID=61149 RepID=A0A2P2J7K3_RHIMU